MNVVSLEPVLFDTAPSPEDLTAVLELFGTPVRERSIRVVNDRIHIWPERRFIRQAACLAIFAPAILCWYTLLIPEFNAGKTFAVVALMAGVAVYFAFKRFTNTFRGSAPYAIIDVNTKSIRLPLYEATIPEVSILCFTNYNTTCWVGRQYTPCVEYGVLAKRPNTEAIAHYNLAPTEGLAFRRELRRMYNVPHWSYIDDDNGRPSFHKVHDT